MSKRNLFWLAAIGVVGVVVWVTAGLLWGLLAGGVTLVISEVLERTARQRRVAASGADPVSPLRRTLGRKRG